MDAPDPSTRAGRAELARLLRGGMGRAEIGRRLGVRPATVADYLWDPDRTRRARPGGRCVCGRAVSGPGRLCPACAGAARARWSAEGVIAALRAWEARHGALPRSGDWSRAATARRGPEGLGRLEGGRWPSPATVIRLFGSFAAARRAAGGEP